MNVQEVISLLATTPKDAEVTLDIDDGLDGNYMPVMGVSERKTIMGKFVVIDADFHRILKKP